MWKGRKLRVSLEGIITTVRNAWWLGERVERAEREGTHAYPNSRAQKGCDGARRKGQ